MTETERQAPGVYANRYRSERHTVHWSVGELDLSSPEYEFRRQFAESLARLSADEILERYVYCTPDEMEAIVSLAEEALPSGMAFAGNGVELGAGTGLLSAVVAKRPEVHSVLAVEVVEPMADLAMPKVARRVLDALEYKVTPVHGSFDLLALECGSADFAVEIGSLHHSADLSNTVKEVARVLKPGGVLVCWDRVHPDSVTQEEIQDMLDMQYGEPFIRDNGYPPGTILTRAENGEHEIRLREWKAAFDTAGLELVVCKALIKPGLKSLVRGLMSAFPYSIRKRVYRTVSMADYRVYLIYRLRRAARLETPWVMLSPINCTLLAARRPS